MILDLKKLNVIGYRFAIFFKDSLDANSIDSVSMGLKGLKLIENPQINIYPVPPNLPPDTNIPFLQISNLNQNIDVGMYRADVYAGSIENTFFDKKIKEEWQTRFSSFAEYFLENEILLPSISRIGLVLYFFDPDHDYRFLTPLLNISSTEKSKLSDFNVSWLEKLTIANFLTDNIYTLGGGKFNENLGILIIRDLTISASQENKQLNSSDISEFISASMDNIISNNIKSNGDK